MTVPPHLGTAYERADKVNAVGFKIALELYVKSRIRRHAEVPIVFGVRVHGESKLSSKVESGFAGICTGVTLCANESDVFLR